MYAVITQCCISKGPAQLLDVVSTDTVSHCTVQIIAKEWPQGIETRWEYPAQLVAHDLSFDRRHQTLKAGKFTALYMTNGRELFSIVYDGKKALLEILDIVKAKNLYQGLPRKLLLENYIFDPKAYAEQIERDRVSSFRKKKEEKERAEKIEEYKENSALYVKSGSSLGGA